MKKITTLLIISLVLVLSNNSFAQVSTIEDFEYNLTWPWVPWTGGGAIDATTSYSGSQCLDPGSVWTYRTDVSYGIANDTISCWTKIGTGRTYWGFGASAAGCFSFVAAKNTGDIQFQSNPGYGYTTLNSTPFNFTSNKWYRMEVIFLTNSSLVGNIYDTDGTTLLVSLNQTIPTLTPGGFAFRGFDGNKVDLLQGAHLPPLVNPCTATISPTIATTCPSNVTVNNDAGNCGAAVTYTAPAGTDDCGTVAGTLTAGFASGATFPIGTTTVSYDMTNPIGTVSCSFTVTVIDAENPTITCPADITINMDAALCTSTATIGTATGTDNCTAPTITSDAPASFPIGNTTVTWTSMDAANNAVTCTQVVTVVDAENPTIVCPTGITINTDTGQCTSTSAIGTATGTDNCTAPTITSDAPANFPIGNTTVTWTSTDAANNTATCTQVVTVVDAENPTITCPADVTINMDAGQCTSTATIGTATGTDNCTAPVITSDAPTSFPVGNTTVTWTSTDAANNAVICTQVVTVVDAENPTIACSGNITSCDTIVTGIAPLSTGDNCVGEFVTYTLTGATTGSGIDDASSSIFNVGTTTVQYIVTDSAGNTGNCSFDVTIHPVTSVTIDPFSPDTICWNATAFNLPIGTPTGGIYTGLGVVDTMFNPDTSDIGSHYIVYTFTDVNSCVNSDSTMITVDLCTGVEENTSFNNVNIYPNPTNGLVHINLGNNNGAINYAISTVEGRIVNQESNVTTNKMTINLSNESKGIYFLRIENNTSSKVYKIIRK